jgi:hypothetical protein
MGGIIASQIPPGNHAALEIDDQDRAKKALKGITGKRLTYRRANEARHA